MGGCLYESIRLLIRKRQESISGSTVLCETTIQYFRHLAVRRGVPVLPTSVVAKSSAGLQFACVTDDAVWAKGI